jgi:hypothetical protein
MARKRDGQFRIKAEATDAEIKKTRRKAAMPRTMVKPVKRTPLIEFLMENESSEKTTRELVAEFRETCGHSYREIAYIYREGTRTTYQVCQICGQFVKGKKGGTLGKTNSKKATEDE